MHTWDKHNNAGRRASGPPGREPALSAPRPPTAERSEGHPLPLKGVTAERACIFFEHPRPKGERRHVNGRVESQKSPAS